MTFAEIFALAEEYAAAPGQALGDAIRAGLAALDAPVMPRDIPAGRCLIALPDRASWLRMRGLLNTVGGSDAGKVVYGAFGGLWAFAYPELAPPKTQAMQAGLDWEDHILAMYGRATGLRRDTFIPPWSIHVLDGWAHASVDAIFTPQVEGAPIVVDAKLVYRADNETDNTHEHHAWGAGGLVDPEVDPCDLPLPPYIFAQALHLMAVTGLQRCDIAALFPFYDLRIYTIPWHEERGQRMMQIVHDAWMRYRVGNEVPPVDYENDYFDAWLTRRRELADAGSREATMDEVLLARDLTRTREAVRAEQHRAKVLKAKLSHSMGNHTQLTQHGRKVATINGGTLRAKDVT